MSNEQDFFSADNLFTAARRVRNNIRIDDERHGGLLSHETVNSNEILSRHLDATEKRIKRDAERSKSDEQTTIETQLKNTQASAETLAEALTSAIRELSETNKKLNQALESAKSEREGRLNWITNYANLSTENTKLKDELAKLIQKISNVDESSIS